MNNNTTWMFEGINMILKAINLALFWRRNNLPSIAFKSLVWGALAWLAVGIFTNVNTALFVGAVVAAIQAIRYGIRNRKEYKQLLKKVGGDKEKLAQVKSQLNTKGFAGGLMTEMLRAELDDDDEDDDDNEEVVVDEETRTANQATLNAQIEKLKDLCLAGGYCSEESAADAVASLQENFGDGNQLPDSNEYIEEFLPNNVLVFETEGYCDDGDHACLVEEFSEACNGRWVIEDCTSHYDEDADKWVVSFTQGENEKTWRFSQSNDCLSESFLRQVMAYVASQSGHIVTVLDSEDFVQIACLPPEIHQEMIDPTGDQLTA